MVIIILHSTWSTAVRNYTKPTFTWFKRHLSVVGKYLDKYRMWAYFKRPFYFWGFFRDTGNKKCIIDVQKAGDPHRQTTSALQYLQTSRKSWKAGDGCLCAWLASRWVGSQNTHWFMFRSMINKYLFSVKDGIILPRSRSSIREVVLVKPSTCLNNFSITAETFEGTPHRAGTKGHDPWVKSVTWEAKQPHSVCHCCLL